MKSRIINKRFEIYIVSYFTCLILSIVSEKPQMIKTISGIETKLPNLVLSRPFALKGKKSHNRT
jgi:hypothetical protein